MVIGIGSTANIVLNLCPLVIIKVNNACKIAWSAYIHGVGNGLFAGLRFVQTSAQVVVKHAVGIVCSNKMFNRQAHMCSEQPCRDIPEIAAWYTEYEV